MIWIGSGAREELMGGCEKWRREKVAGGGGHEGKDFGEEAMLAAEHSHSLSRSSHPHLCLTHVITGL